MANENQIPTHKVCGKCKQLKEMSLFAKNNMGKYKKQSQCNPCRAEYYLLHKPHLKKQIRHNMLNRKYKITQNDYEQMLKSQNGKCAICGLPAKDHRNGILNIDHNHVTKKVRGLLCNNCNRGIGHLKDSIKNIESAIKYLKKNGTYHE